MSAKHKNRENLSYKIFFYEKLIISKDFKRFLCVKFISLGFHIKSLKLCRSTIFDVLVWLWFEKNARFFKGVRFEDKIWDMVTFLSCL
jgi:hypothetical protein